MNSIDADCNHVAIGFNVETVQVLQSAFRIPCAG